MSKHGLLFDGGDGPPDHRLADLKPCGARGRAASTTSLCVLASSSAGNCSVLIHQFEGSRRATLIDAGLSIRRTRLLLRSLGLSLDQVDDVLITHLDGDHFKPPLIAALSPHTCVHVHRRHHRRAMRLTARDSRLRPFTSDQAVPISASCEVRPILLEHDQSGTAVFRITFDSPAASGTLGYATDVGRLSPALIDHVRGVDVLAIESNYCRAMEAGSDRPAFLKDRIMGGSGHLSNDQCLQAIRSIAPVRHVVLLHLSRQCNTPARASTGHDPSGYELTIARHDEPTAPVEITAARASAAASVHPTP